VDAGAKLVFNSRYNEYSSTTHIYGTGTVDLGPDERQVPFPGTIELTGAAAASSGTRDSAEASP
jgi:hypothetical protein